jgi:membrane-associated phospholipid phosphatase
MHWLDDVVTAILGGIAAFIAIMAAAATGWFQQRTGGNGAEQQQVQKLKAEKKS